MQITQIDIFKLNVPFHHPLKVALGEIAAAENIAIKITTEVGLGEDNL